MSTESIKEKVVKLLSKTEENGCTVEEAASALALAQKLLAENNLSVSDLSEATEEIKEIIVKTDTKTLSQIQAEIASSLAKHFGVEILRARGFRTSSLKVIAEETKVRVFVEVFKFAYNAFKRSWVNYHSKLNMDSYVKSLLRTSYLKGFMDGMTNEIIKQENEFGVCVVKSKELREYMEGLNIISIHHYHFKCSSDSNSNVMAFNNGYKDGAYAQRNKHRAITDFV